MLTFLAQSLFEQESYEQSLQKLNKALEIQEELSADNVNINDYLTLNLISKVLSALGNNEEAISYGKMALNSAQKTYNNDSLEFAQAYKTLSQVCSMAEKYQESIQYLNKGIKILQLSLPQKEDIIIEFYTKLTEITLKKLNYLPQNEKQHFNSYLQILKKKYDIMQNAYGYRDKRCIKQKRHLASSYLKYGKIIEAEQELEDILEIEQVVYGQKSVQVAKTLKLLGTVSMSQNELKKAQKYLKKSQGIFHDQGYTNLQKEVQNKLQLLTGQTKFKTNKF